MNGPQEKSAVLEVLPVYPQNSQWNDYVKNDEATKDVYSQDDMACDPAIDKGYLACIHGGEKKKAKLHYLKDCDGVTLSDALGVFDWTCRVKGSNVYAYSLGLKKEKGLKDLIELSEGSPVWKSNKLRVRLNGALSVESSSLVWWSNTLADLPDSSASVVTISDDSVDTGRIYVLSSDSAGYGYEVLDDKTGFLTLNGATFATAGPANCNSADGTQTSPDRVCAFFTSGTKHLWLEGSFDLSNGDTFRTAFVFNDLKFSRVREMEVLNQGSGGTLQLVGDSHSNKFIGVRILSNSGNTGYFTSSAATSRNFYYDMMGSNASTISNRGFVFGGDHDVVYQIKAYSGSARTGYGGGVTLAGNDMNAVKIMSINNEGHGIKMNSGRDRTTLTHVTVMNNTHAGISLNNSSDEYVIHSVLAVNNDIGIGDNGSSQSSRVRYYNLVVVDNTTYGIDIYGNHNVYSDALIIGGNGIDCNIRSGTAPGLIQGTCSDSGAHLSSSYTGQASDALLITGRDAMSSFFGKVTTTDSENTTNTNGVQAYSVDNDYFNFENWFRGWGIGGSVFPNSDHRGRCSSGNCQIWDMRLDDGDTYFLNTSLNGYQQNEEFISGAACPSAVHGDVVISDNQTVANTFLKHATEIMLDGRGDDDGLCESGEACIYAPNIGAYQGEGDYKSSGPCQFVDGAVSDVTMYGYPVNGAL